MDKVIFLYNEANDDLFAFFPDLWEKHNEYACYSHVGQHSSCNINYANESREATKEEYKDLFNELKSIGYNLIVLNK